MGAPGLRAGDSVSAQSDSRRVVGCGSWSGSLALLRFAARHVSSDVTARDLLCCRCGQGLGARRSTQELTSAALAVIAGGGELLFPGPFRNPVRPEGGFAAC